MTFSPLIQRAIDFAVKVHWQDEQQFRKGKDIPYITHPLSVGMILARVTTDENIICAGILHDTIEDCFPYGSVTREVLQAKFNEDVARMVDDVTEKEKSLPWMERKMAALEHIKNMNNDSLLVKSADVLHNLSDLNKDIKTTGDSVFEEFSASKENTINRYQKLIAELKTHWDQNPLLPELEAQLGILEKAT